MTARWARAMALPLPVTAPHELYDACCRAQDRYYNKEDWHNLVKHDMECDFSWDLSAKSYEGLYNETANLW